MSKKKTVNDTVDELLGRKEETVIQEITETEENEFKEEKPENSELNFEDQDTGQVIYHNWEKDGRTFSGKFISLHNNTNPLKEVLIGILFKEYKTNITKMLSLNYVLEQYFNHAETEGYIFRITFLGKSKAKNGEVSNFKIEKAREK
jgi:hypothetical protein